MSLRLEPLTMLAIQLGEQQVIGTTPRGLRRISPILSGTAEGQRLSGEVLPGGADWNLVLADGSIEFHARFTICTADGTLISITDDGLKREVMAKVFAGSPPDLSRGM